MESGVHSTGDRRGFAAHRLGGWLRVAGLAGVFILAVSLLVAISAQADLLTQEGPSKAAQTAINWSRTLDPVIVSGSSFPLFSGVPLEDLFVYSYDGKSWRQIPFQFDEVTSADSTYTAFEDGVLDSNDQLAFMAMDLGQATDLWIWVSDSDAQNYPRYEVRVTNPLNSSEEGWVYVYRSSTLVRAPKTYVKWDAASNRYIAGSYTLGYVPATHFGLDTFELNGTGVDVLDRFKVRLDGICYKGPDPNGFTATEEDIKDISMAPDIAGPVRAGGGTLAESFWQYHSLWQMAWEFDLADFELPEDCSKVVFNWLRVSYDWLDPLASGMDPMTLYDENRMSGVRVDGTPDQAPEEPLTSWKQVSGLRGSVVEVVDYSFTAGTLINYYYDDMVPNTNDTGDQMSFGDAGYYWDIPASQEGALTLQYTDYVLGPSQSNAGYLYETYHNNPLQSSATAQDFDPCLENVGFYLRPSPVYQGVTTTLTATVGYAQPPVTYTWSFDDDQSRAFGTPVNHTFELTGFTSVSLVVTATCAPSEILTRTAVHNVLVFEPGKAHVTYLPLLRKRTRAGR